MNVFFDGFVHLETMINEVIDQVDSALRKKVENEIAIEFHLLIHHENISRSLY